MPKTKVGSAKELPEEVIDTLRQFFTSAQIETLSKLPSVLVETLLKKHPADEETYLEKLSKAFKDKLIKILANDGSNSLIQTYILNRKFKKNVS